MRRVGATQGGSIVHQGSGKVLLVGWDAADWKVIHELMDAGRMPNIKRLIETGTMGNIRTMRPILSPMLWTSIATGKRPHKHGIYGFSEPAADGKSVQPITNLSRKCKAVWNILNQHGKRSIVIGWWPSDPAEPIDGVMVSDAFCKVPHKPGDKWPLRPASVWPHERIKEFAEFRVHPLELTADDIRPFVPDGEDIDQKVDARLAGVMKVTAEAATVQAAATHLLEHEPWDFAAVYFDTIDHYCHGFMKFRAPKQAFVSDEDFRHYRHVVDTGYMYQDMMLGRLVELAGPEATVIVVSDHGFHTDHLRPQFLPAAPAGPASEHREHGIFVASGPGIKRDAIVHGAALLDVTPTILALYGLPVADDMDGRPLLDIFETPPIVARIDSWENVPGKDGRHAPGTVVSSEDTKAALEQLVALGYIDRPDGDAGKAVRQSQRELDFNLAEAYMDAGMFGDAAPLLDTLYRDYPLEFRFGIRLATCLQVLGRHDELAALIDSIETRWGEARKLARKKIREFMEQARERKAHWERLKALDEKDGAANLPALARVNGAGKPILFEDEELEVLRELRAIARGNPESLHYLAATVAMTRGDYAHALEMLEKAKLSRSTNPGFQYQLGNVYLELKRFDDAERAYRRGLEFDPLHTNCHLGCARVWLASGRVDEAAVEARATLGLQYQFPVAHFVLGRALRKLGDPKGAIAALEIALQQNPNFAEAHRELAGIHTRQGQADMAAQHRHAAQSLTRANAAARKARTQLAFADFSVDEIEAKLPAVLEPSNTESFVRCLAQARATDAPAPATPPPEIVIVSGLPRSGTSMMMQMLKAGGLAIHTDAARVADESNPKGYYEADRVKGLATRNDWLGECDGQVLKVVAPLVPNLPQHARYKVIFMRRGMDAVLASQTDMLKRLGEAGADLAPAQLGAVFGQQALSAITLLTLHEHPVLRIAYDDIVADPAATAREVAAFLGGDLDIAAMAAAVDPALKRHASRHGETAAVAAAE